MKKKRSLFNIAAVLALVLAVTACLPVTGAKLPEYRVFAEGTGEMDAEMDLKRISKHGNITLFSGGKQLTQGAFEEAGIDYGDIVTVSFLDQQLDIPVVNNYAEVESGDKLLLVDSEKALLSINMGDFAAEYVADKSTFEDGTYAWTYKKGISDVIFHFDVKTKGGLYSEYGDDKMTYTDERSDYPDLSDEQFANFRVIETTGIGKGLLYRSATPISPKHKRNTYADAAYRKYGIATVMNLSDSEKNAKSYPGYGETYYSTIDYIPLDMSMAFDADDFREKTAEGLRYFAGHKGPYAVHCTEGKDRTGVIAALLECLIGATYEEVVSDYMVTYYNYFGITPEDERYNTIISENIEETLEKMFGTDDLAGADLAAEAEEYCKEIGLTDDEITALRANLSGEQAPAEAKRDYTSLAVFVTALVAGLIAAGVFRRKKNRK